MLILKKSEGCIYGIPGVCFGLNQTMGYWWFFMRQALCDIYPQCNEHLLMSNLHTHNRNETQIAEFIIRIS